MEACSEENMEPSGVSSRPGAMTGCTKPQAIWVLRGPGAKGFSFAVSPEQLLLTSHQKTPLGVRSDGGKGLIAHPVVGRSYFIVIFSRQEGML